VHVNDVFVESSLFLLQRIYCLAVCASAVGWSQSVYQQHHKQHRYAQDV